MRIALDGLPTHADAHQLQAELARVGLDASHAKVHINPLNGRADGQGEVQIRGINKDRLARKLDEARSAPGVMREVTKIKVVFDDSRVKEPPVKPRSGKGGAAEQPPSSHLATARQDVVPK